MWDTVSQDFHIMRLNLSTQTWQDTGVPVDTRSNTHSDVLWDGAHLYIASHLFVGDEQPAVSGSPSYLYRFSYNAATKTYALDSGFPVQINNMRTETLAIARDSAGKLWATWQQDNRIYLNTTNGDDHFWGTPFALPNAAGNVTVDDNSALVTFGGNKIGLMWSNLSSSSYGMFFSVHQDGAADTAWSAPELASPGCTHGGRPHEPQVRQQRPRFRRDQDIEHFERDTIDHAAGPQHGGGLVPLSDRPGVRLPEPAHRPDRRTERRRPCLLHGPRSTELHLHLVRRRHSQEDLAAQLHLLRPGSRHAGDRRRRYSPHARRQLDEAERERRHRPGGPRGQQLD